MKIAFGSYSFKLKSYVATDLQINPTDWQDTTFEVRQKVFHLFWIPFFSLGKFYVRRKHGKLFDLSNEIEEKIKIKAKIRTPWYSFLLPILLVAIPILAGIYIFLAESLMRYNSYNRDKELYENAITKFEFDLKNLKTNSYIRLYQSTLGESNRNSIVLLKVIEINGNNLKYNAVQVHHPENQNEKYYFETLKKDTLTTTIPNLKKAICRDYKILKEFKVTGIEFFNNLKYIPISINYFDEPVLHGGITDWYFWNLIENPQYQYRCDNRGDFATLYFNFQNFGQSADLIEVQNIENNIKLNDSLPIRFPRYEYLKGVEIKAKIKNVQDDFNFKSIFNFKDSLNNKTSFIIEGNQNFFTITKSK